MHLLFFIIVHPQNIAILFLYTSVMPYIKECYMKPEISNRNIACLTLNGIQHYSSHSFGEFE